MINCSFNPFPALRTSRLWLRQISEADIDGYYRLRTEPEVMRYLDRAPARDRDDALASLRNILRDESRGDGIVWAMALSEHAPCVGTVGYWRTQKEHYRAEIGYALLPEHWRRGLMTEALRAILDFGFDHIGLHSVEANVNPNNAASIQLLTSRGFVKEAHFRENYFFDGAFLDSAIYSLLARAHRAMQAS